MWGNSGIVTCVPFFLDQAIGVEGGMPAVGLSEHSTRFFYRVTHQHGVFFIE